MLLLWLLVAAQAPGARPQYDLTNYLTVAAAYGSANHAAALREIREWPPGVDQGRSGRPATAEPPASIGPHLPGRHRVRHRRGRRPDARGGGPALARGPGPGGGGEPPGSVGRALPVVARGGGRGTSPGTRHDRATSEPDARARDPAENRHPGLLRGPGGRGPRRRHPDHGSSVRGEGAPDRAARSRGPARVRLRGRGPRRGAAPPAPRVGRRPPGATRRTVALLDALALDGGLLEARLHLGKLHLERGRLTQAERRLQEVEASSGDDRQRYLARLFLGRLAERHGRPDEAAGFYRRALEAWPDSQAARLALAHAVERSFGPKAALPLVAASLAASQRLDRSADPWWLYRFGPPGLAKAALDRVWTKALDR